MSEIVTATDGTQIDLGNVPQTLAYSGTNLLTITVTCPGKTSSTYRQTFSYTGSNLTGISSWEPV